MPLPNSWNCIRLSCVAVGLIFLFSGCVKNLPKTEKTKTSKTTPEDPLPKIAEKPAEDTLDKAVKANNGDLRAALKSLDVHTDVDTQGRIQYVDLSGQKLTAEGLRHLVQLKDSLERLSLNDAYVTADGLKALAMLPRLRKLELNRTPLTDDALTHLTGLSDLRELSLKHTNIGDAAMEHIGQLKELRQLSLSGTRVTDKGLAPLANLPKLNTLLLEETQITDDGLNHFHSSVSLRFLYLAETKVTPKAVAKFRRTHPNVKIHGL
ncbi:MAG: hypothetical protein Tsb009_27720 [Planctomycetaceae bacterium]